MYKPAQGVPIQSKLSVSIDYLSMLLLLLLLLLHPQKSYAETVTMADNTANETAPRVFRVALLYSTDSALQSKIAVRLSSSITQIQTGTRISAILGYSNTAAGNYRPDLIIAIGSDNIDKAREEFPGISKLLIASDPGSFSNRLIDSNPDAILYMTQPYCRQVQFIHQLNAQWKSIAYFSRQSEPVDSSQLDQCAVEFGMQTYPVSVTSTDHITTSIKDALDHSDLILALPDKDIFNPGTVKNILLTSYRYRKPVIGFSRNFATAGALASIYSDIEQISMSANALVEQYIANDYRFTETVNYPRFFKIEINRQVSKALDIHIPDIEQITRAVENQGPEYTR